MKSNATDYINAYPVEVLESDLERLRRYAEEKRKERDRAIEEYGQAANNLHLCQQILRAKLATQTPALGIGGSPGEGMDQTSSVLALIQESGPTGIRPKEIAKALESRGLVVTSAYLHTILTRLKKRRQVRSQRGSYLVE